MFLSFSVKTITTVATTTTTTEGKDWFQLFVVVFVFTSSSGSIFPSAPSGWMYEGELDRGRGTVTSYESFMQDDEAAMIWEP